MFEWDEAKRRSNIEKHGIDFLMVEYWEWNVALVFADERRDYGEERFIAYVPHGGRLHVVIFAERNEGRRLISARKGNKREMKFYDTEMDPPH